MLGFWLVNMIVPNDPEEASITASSGEWFFQKSHDVAKITVERQRHCAAQGRGYGDAFTQENSFMKHLITLFLFLFLSYENCFAQRMDPGPLLKQAQRYGQETVWISNYVLFIEKQNRLPQANKWPPPAEQSRRLQAFDRSKGAGRFSFLVSLVQYDLQFPGLIWEDSLEILEKNKKAPEIKKLVSHLIVELKKLDAFGRDNFNPLFETKMVDGVIHFYQGSIVQHSKKQTALIRTLGRLQALEARPLILDYLTQPKGPVTQAMHYFMAIGQKEVLITLLDDPRASVSTEAALMLAKYSFKTRKWDLGQEENLSILLAHSKENVRRTAQWKLGMNGDPRGFALLVEYLNTGRTGIKGERGNYVHHAHGLRVLAVLKKYKPEGTVAAISKWIDVIQQNIEANAVLQAKNLRNWGRGYISMDNEHRRLVAIASALGDIGGKDALKALEKIKTGRFERMTISRNGAVVSNKGDLSLGMAVAEARKKILDSLSPE